MNNAIQRSDAGDRAGSIPIWLLNPDPGTSCTLEAEPAAAGAALGLLDDMPFAIYLTDWAGKRITFSNREAIAFLGFTAHPSSGLSLQAIEDRVHPQDRSLYCEALGCLCDPDRRQCKTVEVRVQDCREEWRWALFWIMPVRRIAQTPVTQALLCIQDITERKAQEAQLNYRVCHDPLTDLYNRAYFEAELGRLAHSREYPVSLMMIDVDNLKQVNDQLGHPAGDVLLRRLAEVLKRAFRIEDVIARIGGDEIAVILPRTGAVTLRKAVARVQHTFQQHNADTPHAPLQISMGTATANSQNDNLLDILKQADKAMYHNKHKRKALRQ